MANAATYTLPTNLGTGPFSNCNPTTYVCTGDIAIGNNDVVNFGASMTLSVTGNFTVGNNSSLNGNGNAVTITAGGNIDIGNSNISQVTLLLAETSWPATRPTSPETFRRART